MRFPDSLEPLTKRVDEPLWNGHLFKSDYGWHHRVGQLL